MIDSVHQKLLVWSDRMRGCLTGAMGFKSSSINLWHQIPGGDCDYVPDVLDSKALEECDLIEALITGRAGRISKLSREVVVAYYFSVGTWEQKARDFKVSKSTFCGYLHNAQVQIGAALENKRVPVVARGVGVRVTKTNIRAACNDEKVLTLPN